ncbi:hypothetical protein F5884DRAFT_494319 [Xylogone sp. PMI_703]|nr:hypothetical protein F5884DRAFT_494319 [Xylogone sp. PMI_703]
MSSAVEPRQKSLQNPITTETRDSSNVNSSASSLQNQKIDKKALDTSSQKQEQKYKRAPSGTSKSDATGDGRELISSTSSTLANSQASNRTKNGNTASSGSPSAQESPHPPNPNPADGIGSSSSSGGTPQTEGQRTSSKQKLAPHALSQGSKSQQAPFTSIGETQSQQKDFAYMTIKYVIHAMAVNQSFIILWTLIQSLTMICVTNEILLLGLMMNTSPSGR